MDLGLFEKFHSTNYSSRFILRAFVMDVYSN